MQEYRLALIGFGTVGQGLAEILLAKQAELAEQYGFRCRLVGICDYNKGSIFTPEGLDIQQVLNLVQAGKSLTDYQSSNESDLTTGLDSLAMIQNEAVDVIAEMTYTDIKTGGAAVEHCETAFENGKHVVTTNKGPVAVKFQALNELAKQHQCFWGIEGTVMSGTPVINLIREQLQGACITKLSGIFNGTCNYILTQMESGTDYETALKDAQQKGYAEADPTADVAGKDVLAKVVILANVVMGENLTVDQVDCTGIEHLTLKDIQQAQQEEKAWKLLGEVVQTEQGVQAKVAPQKIELSHPLAAVKGATNAITIENDMLGAITMTGPGAGKVETGYALLADLLAMHRYQN